jgi:hypothetical protein
LGGIDVDHDYCVRIPFTYGDMTIYEIERYQQTNIKAVEMFGLAGDKYTCRVTGSAIEFWFRDAKDAILFELTCG